MDFRRKCPVLGKLLVGLVCAALLALNGGVQAQASEFVWPAPGISYLYRGFGNGHYGLDIAADKGTQIYAAAAGTVMEVYTGCNNYDGAKEGGKPCQQKGGCNPSKGYYKDGFCNSAYGNAVIIRHDNGIWTSYAHLTSVNGQMKVGARVTQGQLVGISGSTGRSSGAHLHFEMRSGSSEYFWLNTAFDPLTRVSSNDSINRDTTKPVIRNVQVYNVTQDGYWVSCEATDDTAVARVVFPTWTTWGGQDDLRSDWNSAYAGSQSGNTWTFYVNISQHNFESGVYTTHIYAYDSAGNAATVNAGLVTVPVPVVNGEILPGDVTLDGAVTAADALLILKQSAAITSMNEPRLQVADVTGDGIINAADALWVLRKAAGML